MKKTTTTTRTLSLLGGIIAIALLCGIENVFAQRYIKQNPKTYYNFSVVDFADQNNGMIAGNGVVLRTTDAGVTWTQFTTPATFTSISLASPSLAIGMALRTIYRSTDGGANWQGPPSAGIFSDPGPNADLTQVSMARGSLTGIAVGLEDATSRTSIIYRTADGGINWTRVMNGYSYGFSGGVSMGSLTTAIAYTLTSSRTMLFTSDGGNNWLPATLDQDPIRPGGINPFVPAAQMTDGSWGYAACQVLNTSNVSSTVVERTTDGGITWTRVDIGAGAAKLPTYLPAARLPISFFNRAKGAFLIDRNGGYDSLRITGDSGVTWTSKAIRKPPSFPSGLSYRSLAYISDNVIIVAGDNGIISRTTDTGTTWTSTLDARAYYTGTVAANNSLRGMAMNRSGVGISVGGGIVRTTNTGTDWKNVTSSPISPNGGLINDVAFANDTVVIAVVDSNRFLRSTDGGLTWSAAQTLWSSSSISRSVRSVAFLGTLGFGIAVGDSGKCARTTNYGLSWTQVATGTANLLRNVTIKQLDSLYIYACGDGSTVIYSVDSGKTWKNRNSGLPVGKSLYSITIADTGNVFVVGDSATTKKIYRFQANLWSVSNNSFGTVTGLGAITALTSSVIIAGNSSGQVVLSKNGGSSWFAAETTFTDSVNDIYAVAPTDVYFATNKYQIWRRVQGEYVNVLPDIDFGSVQYSPDPQTKDVSVAITNTGTDTLTFTSFTLKKGTAISRCSVLTSSLLKILPSQTDSVKIRFSPLAAQNYGDTLILTSNALSRSLDTIILTGTGTSTNISIAVDPNNIDYGAVRTSKLDSFKITSAGDDPLKVTNIKLRQNIHYSIVPPMSYPTINPGDNVWVKVVYAPKDTGMLYDTVVVENNSVTSAAYVYLRGYGVQGHLVITDPESKPYTMNYGNVLVSKSIDSVIRFENRGSDTLTIDSISKRNDADSVYTIKLQPVVPRKLAPAEKDSVVVTYTSKLKTSTAQVIIYSTPAKKDTVFLLGTGVNMVLINPKPLIDFGNVSSCGVKDTVVVIDNQSTTEFRLDTARVKSPFTVTGGGGKHSVASGARDSVHIRFMPQDTSLVHDTLFIISNTPTDTTKIVLTGKGQDGVVSITPQQISYGNVSPGLKDTTVKIVNTRFSAYHIDTAYVQDTVHFHIISGAGKRSDPSCTNDSVVVRFVSTIKAQHKDTLFIVSNSAKDTVKIPLFADSVLIGIDDERVEEGFFLGQNYPNPFTNTTTITFSTPLSRGAGGVLFEVRDILGRILYTESMKPDQKAIRFDGSILRTGMYFYSLTSHPDVVRIMSVAK